MVRFWVGFALFVAAVAAIWHAFDGPGTPLARIGDHVFASESSTQTRGSGNTTSETRTVGPFDRIHAEGASVIEVDVRDGLANGVEVRTDDNLLPRIRTSVVDGVLEIAPEEGLVSLSELHVKVTMPSLTAVHLEGANRLVLGIESRGPLELRTDGAGRIKATGHVDALTMRSEGAGSIEADGLVARAVDVRLDGAGKATVHATESLKARIDGAGIVRYAGNPASVDREIDGIGHISKID